MSFELRTGPGHRIETLVGEGFVKSLLDGLDEGVYLVTRDRRVLVWNRGAERITGFTREDVVGRGCAENLLVHTDDQGRPLCFSSCPLTAAMEGRKETYAHVYCRHRDGHRIPVSVRVSPVFGEDGEVVGAIETFSDDSEARVLREEVARLAEQASTDPLTGLPNRRAFDEALDLAIYRFERHGHSFGLLLLDLDRFKAVNDGHGHAIGDTLLQAVARTLSYTRRRDEIVARWGGEEFALLVQPIEGVDRVRAVADRFRAMVGSTRIAAPQGLLSVTASVGASLARKGEDAPALLERVDRLLYRSKADGRDRVTVD